MVTELNVSQTETSMKGITSTENQTAEENTGGVMAPTTREGFVVV